MEVKGLTMRMDADGRECWTRLKGVGGSCRHGHRMSLHTTKAPEGLSLCQLVPALKDGDHAYLLAHLSKHAPK